MAIEASESPHIDDIVVYRPDRTTYYQLKRIQKGSFTGSALFGATDGPPVLAKLFEGWCRVRSNVDQKVEVVVATNASLSSHPTNKPLSPAEFDRDFLTPLKRSSRWRPEAKQAKYWHRIRKIAGAQSDSELADFLHVLRLQPDEPSEEELRVYMTDILRGALRPGVTIQLEVGAWVERVYDLATEVGASRRLTRNQIGSELQKLFGARRRRLEHVLSLPENHVPREGLAQTVLEQAQQLEKGYLLVTGPPGSGKTTLATWLADSYPKRIVLRYHVFHPQRSADIERSTRATALSFVTELLQALADRFPKTIERYAPSNDTFADAIAALWNELGQLDLKDPAIIIVDGIDHVFRANQKDGEMLFEGLRRDAPPGVVFVLFGQPGWPYPAWIESISRVEVPPFTSREVELLLTATFAWDSADPALSSVAETLREQTSGNPLSLFYALSSLKDFDSARQASDELGSITFFGDEPHLEYGLLLDHVENNVAHKSKSFRRDLLAWLAVALASITTPRLIAAFAGDKLSEREAVDILETLRPVLVETAVGEFKIFHDDFRRFAEKELSFSARKEAHQRHVRALRNSYGREEVRALSEHLWFSERYEELAELPSSRTLADWFVEVEAEQVKDLFRLGCAATLKYGSEAQIIASCLAYKNALDASPPWYEEDVSWRNPKSLKAWSFLPPPEEIDDESLRRCTDALTVAAKHIDEDPQLAATIAQRFSIPHARWPDGETGLDFGRYLAAWSKWLMLSGHPEEVGSLIKDSEHGIGGTLAAVEGLLSTEAKPEILEVWIAGLTPAFTSLDRRIVKSALRHLAAGRSTAAGRIVQSLSRNQVGLSSETKRDIACLLCLLGESTIPIEHASAKVRVSQGYSSDGLKWRELFFAGMVEGYLGVGKEPLEFDYPDARREFVERIALEGDSIVAELCWRCGVVVGVVKRSPGSVRSMDVTSSARPFLEGHPSIRGFGGYALVEPAEFYLPLLAQAVSGEPDLSNRLCEVLLKSADGLALHYGSRSVGVLEALWILAPDKWKCVAERAISSERLPESDYDSRYQWFGFWRSRASARGVTIPPEFDRRASVSLLGVYRKTYPTSLAIELLELSIQEPGFKERLRELIDVLMRVDKEPEGGRASFRGLPQVLGLALASDAGLFVDEVQRTCSGSSIAEPFDSTRGLVAESVLGHDSVELASEDLFALWHWVAASPGSDRHAENVARLISERLHLDGKGQDADSIEAWSRAISPAREAQAGGDSLGGTEVSQEPASKEHRDGGLPLQPLEEPDLSDIKTTWFSAWWSRDERAFLEKILEHDPEGWTRIRSALAEKLADGTGNTGNIELVAEALPSLRPDLDPVEAFEAALNYVRMRVQFQEEPTARTETSCPPPHTRADALIRLTAMGLEAQGAEVVRRALRGLAAMGQHSVLCPLVEAEVSMRLGSVFDRTIGDALAILRQLPHLTGATLEQVQAIEGHRNAWCRWLACTVRGTKPEWLAPPAVAVTAGPIISEPIASKSSVGGLYFSDPSSVREIYVRRLKNLIPLDEEAIRERIELEYRSLPEAREHLRKRIAPYEGPGLMEHGMGSAAARAISSFLASVPAEIVPAMLSAAALFDPWLALGHPKQDPRANWLELAVAEDRVEDREATAMLRSLCVVPRNLWVQLSQDEVADFASIAFRLMIPEAPNQFAWVSEKWDQQVSAHFATEAIQPLAFLNQPFTELVRDRFQLVPRWDLPIGAGLRYDNSPRPCWGNEEQGTVIEAVYEEWKGVRPGVRESPSWRAGWYISPGWLKKALKPIMESHALVTCCRVETGTRTEDSSDEVSRVSYRVEEVDVPR